MAGQAPDVAHAPEQSWRTQTTRLARTPDRLRYSVALRRKGFVDTTNPFLLPLLAIQIPWARRRSWAPLWWVVTRCEGRGREPFWSFQARRWIQGPLEWPDALRHQERLIDAIERGEWGCRVHRHRARRASRTG